ncbi:MAG: class I SAM-dependent methyltransferase [Arcobacter sp.]|uniref:class I SAM-dependent methyltransferase n=1 Tax=Arcobacter sp. TaxID=1872629 RepID=UPI003C741EE2
MKKVFRDKNNSEYWEDRWINSGVDEDEFKNEQIYPIVYSNKILKGGEKILEAGCGAGRVYFHYKNKGFDIKGIEYSINAVSNILKKDSSSRVIKGNICQLPYSDKEFDVILSFGLYHNIENEVDLKKAFSETNRVLKNGGKLVASVRFDSFENNIIEKIVRKRTKSKDYDKFHRWHFSLKDMENFLDDKMFIQDIYYTRNVSFLFKYDLFRKKELKSVNFQESNARSNGFELNLLGKLIDKTLHSIFPTLFSNLLVIIAEKKK